MGKPKRTPDCHPNAKHQAFGLCHTCYNKQYTASHREAVRAYGRAFFAAHRADRNAYNRAYYALHYKTNIKEQKRAYAASHVEELRAYRASRRLENLAHGLRRAGCASSFEEIMEVARHTECDVCGSTVKLHIDHDHYNGCKVRGRLCQSCNHTLGLVKDNPDTLRALADYIEKYRELHSQP